jgi:hypothetical protein
MRALYFNHLVTAGVTLDEQAKALAGWIEESVALINENPPPSSELGPGPAPIRAG